MCPAMKKCPACNSIFPDDSSFCSNDGIGLIESQDSPPSEFRFSCLGGLDSELPSAWSGRITTTILWTSGILVFLVIGVVSIGFRVPRNNDLSAIQSVHAIQIAQSQYADTYPSIGFACSLKALGGDRTSGPASPSAAQI